MNKMSGIDLDLIEQTSINILGKKSKDIRVMFFLSWKFLRSGDWERLADIYDGLGTLIEQNYDALFPEKNSAKQLAFKWLSENRVTTLLEEKKPTEADYDHIARLLAGLTKIKPVLEKKFEKEGSPFPSAFFSAVQKWEKACKPKPKIEPQPSQTAGAAGGASGAQGAAAAAEPMETPKQAQAIIRKAALFLIEKEGTRPMGYRLLRAARWDAIEKAPPAEGGKTQIAGPNAQQRAYFAKLVADKEWKTVVEKTEAAFAGGGNHLWLDLQRYSAAACKELGPEYSSVRNAVILETAMLINRVPELTALSFSDGTPFCDDATKEWLTTDVKPALGAADGKSPQPDVKSGGDDPFVEEQRTVDQLVASGKIEEALVRMQTNLRSSTNERERFRRTIVIGSLLLKAKQPDIAVSLLEFLDRKIEEHGLDRWDPDMAVEAWAALFTAYKAARVQKSQNVQAAIQEKQNAIISKISHIDPGKAFTLNK